MALRTEREVCQEGYEAYKKDGHAAQNEYLPGTWARSAWYTGYRQALREDNYGEGK